MNLTEVQISEVKNLNLIYIFTTDHILRSSTEKYIGAKVVFDENRTLSLDYKSPYFEDFLKRIIERYNKEKDSRNIILLGKLTPKIINDETLKNLGKASDKKTIGLTMFDTKNHELKKYESYLIDALEHILKIGAGYEAIKIDKIDGYNNKFVIFYSVGTVNLECRLILSFRDETHLDFSLSRVDKTNLGISGTIENNVDYVSINWSSSQTDLSGSTTYNVLTNETERKIVSNNETVMYNETSDTITEEDNTLVDYYLSLFNIPKSQNMIKTGEYNYMLGEETILNSEQTELFYKHVGTQISISDNEVVIRHQIHNGLNKYGNRINVTLDKTIHDITMTKLTVEKEDYVFIEHKTTNEFGSVYEYNIYKVDNIDFKTVFTPTENYELSKDIKSLEEVKRYIRKIRVGGDK